VPTLFIAAAQRANSQSSLAQKNYRPLLLRNEMFPPGALRVRERAGAARRKR